MNVMGLASGLDYSTLIPQLVDARYSARETRLNIQESTVQAQISGYGTVLSSVSGLTSPLNRLKEFDYTKSVSSSDTALLRVTADSTATAGQQFSIEVSQLAQVQKIATPDGTFASGASEVMVSSGNTATLGITVGSGDTVTVDLDASGGDLTLTDVVSLINESEADVVAAIVDGRLVLTGTETGEDNTIVTEATGTDHDGALSLDGTDNTVGAYDDSDVVDTIVLQAATNAEFTIDTIAFTSDSNTIDDAVEGLTFTLLDVTDGDSVRVAVTDDTSSSLRALFNEFVGNYNEVITTLDQLTNYDAENERASLLTGDSTLRLVESQLRSGLNYTHTLTYTNDDGVEVAAEISLATLGLTSSATTGQISFNQTTFTDAVEEYGLDNIISALVEQTEDADDDGVNDVISIADNFSNIVSGLTDPYDGILPSRREGLTATQTRIDSQRERLVAQMDAYEAQLVTRFTNLDGLIAKLNSGSGFLDILAQSTSIYNR
jgi:flagellar hook-associated protein 2